MNKIGFPLCFFLVLSLVSCFSAPPKNKEGNTRVYFYQNENSEPVVYESIGLVMDAGGVIYSLDWDNKTKTEFGKFSIEDGVITIDAGKFKAVGTISDEKIVIDGKEFIRLQKT